MSSTQNTYERAQRGYDDAHEQALLEVVTEAIFKASTVSDCNAVVLRTGEIAKALTTALAGFLAMSPSATRSPAAIRKITDDFNKHLRSKVSAAEQCDDLKEFVRRTDNGNGPEGTA